MLKPRRKSAGAGGDHPTRTLLVGETSRQIEEFGVVGVDIETVLTKAGVTKGALYHHFGSVNDLVIAGLLHAFAARMEEAKAGTRTLVTECSTAREARERLNMLIKAYHEIPARNPLRSLRLQAFTLALTEPKLAPEIAKLQTELTHVMTEVAREMQARGWLRSEFDPRTFAALVQALNQGRIVDDIVEEADRVDPDEWISLVGSIFDRNLFTID